MVSLTFESVPLTKLSLHLFLKLLHEGAPRLGLAIHLPFVRNDHELCHRLAEEPEEGAVLGGIVRRGPWLQQHEGRGGRRSSCEEACGFVVEPKLVSPYLVLRCG